MGKLRNNIEPGGVGKTRIFTIFFYMKPDLKKCSDFGAVLPLTGCPRPLPFRSEECDSSDDSDNSELSENSIQFAFLRSDLQKAAKMPGPASVAAHFLPGEWTQGPGALSMIPGPGARD